MMKPLKDILGLNWFLLMLMLALTAAGIYFIGCATDIDEGMHPLVRQQIMWTGAGLAVFLFFALVNYEVVLRFALPIFVLSILSLVAVLLFGKNIMGATRWIQIGNYFLQPAEPAKIAFILGLAWFLVVLGEYRRRLWFFLLIGVVALVPFFLIYKQPDMGTALTLFPVTLVMMWGAGVPRRYLMLLLAVAGLGAVFAYAVVYRAWWDGTVGDLAPAGQRAVYVVANRADRLSPEQQAKLIPPTLRKKAPPPLADEANAEKKKSRVILKPYQLDRIKTFFNPDLDPLGAGWTIRQSLNSIGSGGFKGKGYVSEYSFLPKNIAYNDFIFAVVGEVGGFVGSVLFIAFHAALIVGVMYVAAQAKDVGGALICLGFAAVLFAHFFQNIGMTIRIMPITGIPLPFTSYGGSFLLTCMAGMGLVQSVWINRKNLYNH